MIAYVFPGQGSQHRGMGSELFSQFPLHVSMCDEILGYSIEELCVSDPQKRLNLTEYTQPALYTVNALSYLSEIAESYKDIACVAGHSLGEYNALFAAGAFDFETGLKLVQQRGKAMAKIQNGGMAAIVGLELHTVEKLIADENMTQLSIANYNAPSQFVLAGDRATLKRCQPVFEKAGGRFVVLNVSAAFHSEMMKPAALEFEQYVQQTEFSALNFPVIANVNAQAYGSQPIGTMLVKQLTHPVRWIDTLTTIKTFDGVRMTELGPGTVLTRLARLHEQELPDSSAEPRKPRSQKTTRLVTSDKESSQSNAIHFGSDRFRRTYGTDQAYMCGALYRGVSSKEVVKRAAKNSVLACLTTDGFSVQQVGDEIDDVQREVGNESMFGVSLVRPTENETAEFEQHVVDACLEKKVRLVEAVNYLQDLSLSLVRYRIAGLSRNSAGDLIANNKIIARLSRPEIAQAFLSPAPSHYVKILLEQGAITKDQANWASQVPMADDLCVESGSCGYTRHGVTEAVLPSIKYLRDTLTLPAYSEQVGVGLLGGIGTPEAVMTAFMLGADFIQTRSINQCTVEAGTSSAVKDVLASSGVQDVEYLGRSELCGEPDSPLVLSKSVFFHVRANKLQQLFASHDSFSHIDKTTRQMVEQKLLHQTFDDAYRRLGSDFTNHYRPLIERSLTCDRAKMAAVFLSYFWNSGVWAVNGKADRSQDYHVRTGSGLGAFNQWVERSELTDWRLRHVDQIARKLMLEGMDLCRERMAALVA